MVSIVGLFIIGLPAVFYQSVMKAGGLESLWLSLPILYGGITFTLSIYILFLDWDALSKEIIEENTTVNNTSESETENEKLLKSNSTSNVVTERNAYGSVTENNIINA